MSSFYDLASLVMIPSGKKAGKVYSQKPLTTDGQLDFTRASTATRIGPDGKIEKTRTNLILQSNTFNTTWTLSNASLTSGQSGHSATNNAWKLVGTGGNNDKVLQSVANGLSTFSIYAKAGNKNFALISLGNGFAYYNIQTGVVTSSSGVVSTNIVSIGNGWYRLSITVLLASSTNVQIYIASADGSVATNNGDFIYIQDAQLEQGLVATNVITTTTAAVSVGSVDNMPRLNYTFNSATSCPSLLLEPQRTNLETKSEYFANWTLVSNVTRTTNYTTSPDGSQNASRIQFTANGFLGNIITSSGTEYTLSCYAKRNDSGSQSFGFFKDGSGVVNSEMTLTSNWQRFEYTYTAGASSYVGLAASSGADVSVFGYQIEAASYATSYIPTFGATVTRVADACSKTGISGLIGTTEGVMFIDIQTPSTIQTNTTFSIGSGTSGEYAQLEIRTDLSINWRYRVGSVDYINSNVGSFTAGDRLKIAFAYKNLDSNLYLNGVSIATDTGTITTNAWSEVKYSNFIGTAKLEAEVNKTILFKTRLSNTQLAELTSLDS